MSSASDMQFKVAQFMASVAEHDDQPPMKLGKKSARSSLSSVPTLDSSPSSSEISFEGERDHDDDEDDDDENNSAEGSAVNYVEDEYDSDVDSFEGESSASEDEDESYCSESESSSYVGTTSSRTGSAAMSVSETYRSRSQAGSSTMASSDWSSSEEDDSDYDDLMAEMPIALGRQGAARPAQGRPAHAPPAIPAGQTSTFPQPSEGLPVPINIPENLDSNPLEGLAMLQNIRSELEQVGRLIVAKKDGAKFLQRAHILASINWLATNVPSSVLEHLGNEIRALYDIETEHEANGDQVKTGGPLQPHTLMNNVNVIEDDQSEASDLSDAHYSDSSTSEHDDMSARPQDVTSDDEEEDEFMFDDAFAALPAVRPEVTVSWNPEAKTNEIAEQESPLNAVQRYASYKSMDSYSGDSQSDEYNTKLPSVEYFQCALLFVDISGFTRLSTLLDPENLSKVINSYFQKIVDYIDEFQGDIQKFAGDALFAEWRVRPGWTLEQCVEAAAACSAKVVRECADYPVLSFGSGNNDGIFEDSSPVSTLNVHCGLGCGEMAGIHVGDDTDRREYLFLGDPIVQAGEACEKASLGECVASLRFNYVLKKAGANDGTFSRSDNKERIARQDISCVCPARYLEILQNRPKHHKTRGVTDHIDGLDIDALIEYRRRMSLYVHPVVVSNDVAVTNDFKSSKTANNASERHREEAELRSVYVMFINPLIPINLTGNKETDRQCVERMNDIMNLVTRELKRYSGHLRQFIIDDKGVVLIATFGLRGSSFPNMVAERALPATIVIHNALLMELDVRNKIGATFGDVYCGAVGGEERHEYACMGPSVNLAARLMCSKDNPGILVDNAVRNMANRTYGFNALPPVKAKGYTDLVPIFEPLSPLDRTWGRVDPYFVGREEEIRKLLVIAKDMARMKHVAPKVIMVSGSSGTGKSTLIVHAIERIGKMIGHSSAKALIVAKHVGKEQDSLVPFATIKSIIGRLLWRFQRQCDDTSLASGLTGRTSTSGSKGLRSSNQSAIASLSDSRHSKNSSGSNSRTPCHQKTETILNSVFEELGAGGDLAAYVKRLLVNSPTLQADDSLITTIPPASAVVSVLARVVSRCTEDARLTILALDDAHQADEMSWEVLRQVFDTVDNVMILGTTYSTTTCTVRVHEMFWEQLNTIHLKNGRYVNVQLEPLTKDEIVQMTMKSLGKQRDDISPNLLNEVWTQSGGMPHFASEILTNIKRRIAAPHDPKSSLVSESVSEIILHRIDSFDTVVRNVLNVGAVMGTTFTFQDVMSVVQESNENDSRGAELRRQTTEALQVAIKEGILYTGSLSEASDNQQEVRVSDDTVFTFYHSVWQSTLVGLMLHSRKRDVHRKIAQTLETRAKKEDIPIELKKKMFEHWIGAGDTTKAAQIALQVGSELEVSHRSPVESLRIYEDTLCLWRWDERLHDGVAGFSKDIIDYIGAEHLVNIISVMVAMGRALSLAERHKDSVSAYENALRILQTAKKADEIRDRSIIFPAFIGISNAIAQGHISQDSSCRYEQALLRRFLQETRSHGRLIHHIHALYLQLDLYGRQHELEKAIAVQSVIKNLYKPDKHSRGLRKHYGQDSAAVSMAMSAYWNLSQGSSRHALKMCRTILKELVPKIETDFNQSFNIMFPLVMILKEAGYSAEATGFFQKVVVQPHMDCAMIGGPYELLKLRTPLTILFDLTNSKQTLSEERLQSYINWAANPERMVFGQYVNKRCARLGRCADSLSAEICQLLASRLPDGLHKDTLLSHGSFLANQAVIFSRKYNYRVAQNKAQSVWNALRSLSRGRQGQHNIRVTMR